MTTPDPIFHPDLDPAFWANPRAGVSSAWHGHVPFAQWLVSAIQPRLIVELGTHAGVSYAAFCQAVVFAGLPTQCFAVDSWAGDDHAGAYAEKVFTELSRFHDARYAGFSRLVRSRFDAALDAFADGSIDLLHIDGFHSYEAVCHDFLTWLPKLSDRAVVLFHDIHVHERGFGVWKFWEEIRHTGTASFDFVHGYGLGVLATGTPPQPILGLAADPDRMRHRFETLGRLQMLEHSVANPPEMVAEEPGSGEPIIDPAIDCGAVHIAERFVAPPALCALRLPRDALTRGTDGCSVWVVAPNGQDWRQGRVTDPPDDVATLVFNKFDHTRPRHFHLFVTEHGPHAEAAGLPQALADRLIDQRPPVALDTPGLSSEPQSPHSLKLLPS